MIYFRNRTEAGRELSARLRLELDEKPDIVLGIPTGGLVVAYMVAGHLELPLSAVLARRILDPRIVNEDVSAGVVGANGEVKFSPGVQEDHFLKQQIMESGVVFEAKAKMEVDRKRYKVTDLGSLVGGKFALVVDDGVATGATAIASISEVLSYSPRKVVLAAPVVDLDAYRRIIGECPDLWGIVSFGWETGNTFVGQHYADFKDVSPDLVAGLL